MTLPDRTQAAEDRFVAQWRDQGEHRIAHQATEAALSMDVSSRQGSRNCWTSGQTEEPRGVDTARRAGRLRLLGTPDPTADDDETSMSHRTSSRKERSRARQRASLKEARGITGEGRGRGTHTGVDPEGSHPHVRPINGCG